MNARLERRFRVLIAGVGGQGALTVARILGEAALEAGHEVMVSQLHGMSQRGGDVECAVVLGPGESAFVGLGQADVVLGLEPLETLRSLSRMSARTHVVMSRGGIVPMHMVASGTPYPSLEACAAQIRAVTPALTVIDALALAHQAGAPRALNTAMLGALAGLGVMPLDAAHLLAAVQRTSPPAFQAINQRAFELGARAVSAPRPDAAARSGAAGGSW